MLLPPMVVDVRIRERGERSFRVWLPVVLLWPLLLVLVGFALVISVPVDLVLWISGSSYHHSTLMIFGALGVLSAARGTQVNIAASDATLVSVDIY